MQLFEKAPLVSLNDRKFLLSALEHGIRGDGRSLYDLRNVSVKCSNNGTATIEWGSNRVLCSVSGELGPPRGDKPVEGQLSIHLNLSPMASRYFEQGRQTNKVAEVSRMVERNVRDSNAVDMEAMCVLGGKMVWNIRVDIHVLNYDGNVVDTSTLAALAALTHFRYNDVTVVGDNITVHPFDIREPKSLLIKHYPLSFTFALYHDGATFILDPSEREELLSEGMLMICVNKHGEMCSMQKAGGVAVSLEIISRACAVATKLVTALTQTVLDASQRETSYKARPSSHVLKADQEAVNENETHQVDV